MTDVESPTLEVLKDILVELRGVRAEVRKTNERLSALELRQAATEGRLVGELTSVIGAIHDLKLAVVEGLDVKKQVDDHELRLSLLESRTNG